MQDGESLPAGNVAADDDAEEVEAEMAVEPDVVARKRTKPKKSKASWRQATKGRDVDLEGMRNRIALS
jgi:hypothetical protein